MSDNRESDDERPCLHCLIGDVIDDFYAEYGTLSGETDAIDVDEVVSALAKTIAIPPPMVPAPITPALRMEYVRVSWEMPWTFETARSAKNA